MATPEVLEDWLPIDLASDLGERKQHDETMVAKVVLNIPAIGKFPGLHEEHEAIRGLVDPKGYVMLRQQKDSGPWTTPVVLQGERVTKAYFKHVLMTHHLLLEQANIAGAVSNKWSITLEYPPGRTLLEHCVPNGRALTCLEVDMEFAGRWEGVLEILLHNGGSTAKQEPSQ